METIQISVLIIAGLLLVIIAFAANTKPVQKGLDKIPFEPAHWIPFWILWILMVVGLIAFNLNYIPPFEEEQQYLILWPSSVAFIAPGVALAIARIIKAYLDERAKKKALPVIEAPVEDAIELPTMEEEEHPVEKAKREALKAAEDLFRFRNGGQNGK